jgi:uncharacterized Tic20 family protein
MAAHQSFPEKEAEMSEQMVPNKDEKNMAGLAHGSILLGLFTNGVGGILAALVIWITQRDKSDYVAAQSLQALVYQALVFAITMAAWCCWGALYTAMIMLPLITNPGAYETSPPASLWLGLFLMVAPMGLWALTTLYGLYASLRCFGGHDFKYVIVGNWLESQR